MSHILKKRSTVATALLIALSACSSGSSDSPSEVVENVVSSEPTETPNSTDTSETVSTVTPDAELGPAQFIVGECGSIPSANTAATTSVDNPAEFFVGEPVDGEFEEGFGSEDANIWRITLEPGNYHFVVDTWALEPGVSALGMDVNTLDERLSGNQQSLNFLETRRAFEQRSSSFFEIPEARVLTISLDNAQPTIQNYTMGIFANGTAVPSPTFRRCLPQNPLALGSTQSVTIEPSESREDDVWYQLELGSGEYSLDASASNDSSGLISYDFVYRTDFGGNVSQEEIVSRVTSAASLNTTSEFEIPSEGTVWIRARNDGDIDTTVEFTINEL